jgi:broad specificity phosphatase PhoE
MTGSRTRLLLIRHAHIDPAGRLYGAFDAPLSQQGKAALEALRARTPTRAAPDALYTSTLSRAVEVASLLGRSWGLAPRSAASMREIDCGRVEGMRLDDVRVHYGPAWMRNESETDDDFAWPGGETYRAFRARVLAGLAAIAAKHRGQRVAIVTHSGVVSQVLGALRQRKPAVWRPDRPDPLTATELTWNGSGPDALITYNDPDWF